MKKLIAVTIGDINGIGIKILIKEWKNKNLKNFVLFSNLNILKKYLISKKINIKLNKFNKNIKKYCYSNTQLNIFNIEAKNDYFNTYNSLLYAYKYTKIKNFIGIVTLPLNKKLINKNINNKFIDQTNFFTKQDKKTISNMVFIYKNIFIVPLTIHIKLIDVEKYFKNKKSIKKKILSLNKTLVEDFRIKKPKFLISGINPHAGENGLIGDNEINDIIPIVTSLKKNKILIKGPISGDSMINKNNLKNYDCFLFTFHDQALIPFKMLSNYQGVNYTANLNIIRTSPDHGTAYDKVNIKKFSSESILNSFKIVRKIYINRKKID